MRRAAFATALGGALAMAACAAVAGLGETYSPPRDGTDADDDDVAAPLGDSSGSDVPASDAPASDAPASDARDAHVAIDAAEATVPTCSSFTCPTGSEVLLCDDFSSTSLNGAWTRFDSDNVGLAATKIDSTIGCPAGSLLETSNTDTDYGVYSNFESIQELKIEADILLDKFDPSGEGDLFKIAVPPNYDVRLHYGARMLYVLEVDNSIGQNYAHTEAWRVVVGTSWIHVSLEVDRGSSRCSLVVDHLVVTDGALLHLKPPGGTPLQAALSPRYRSGGELAIHVDNVVVEGR
jgi:hypothetical protein